MTIRKAVAKIHLWLGLASGPVVFVVAVTGCLYAFQKEIQDWTQPFRFVERQIGPFLPPSVLKAVAEKELPDRHVHAVQYLGPDRAAQVIFYNTDPEYYYLVYVNPYTGDVLAVKDMARDFFAIVLDGHFYLWLPPGIGQPVVASATLVFVVMLISGLVLWWPRKPKQVRQRFAIRWNAKWKRVNYDLHNVVGFYAWAVAILLASTGLVWGFQWWANGWYRVAGGEKSLVYSEPASDTTQVYPSDAAAIDKVFAVMQQQYPDARSIEVHIPVTAVSPISANANPDEETYWKLDYRYFDQYTLEELSINHVYGRYDDATAADKLVRMNYDVHTGAILGLPGKFLVFFASLLCASLPVTGFVIWWGRKYKKKRDASVKKFATPNVRKRKPEAALEKVQIE
ncbi:MAG TPA: PepSY-associated TM helix domain-containing protein [Cyclobacteriaceae bacterium]